eukprot:c38193_g1_i1 orf=65-229(+)
MGGMYEEKKVVMKRLLRVYALTSSNLTIHTQTDSIYKGSLLSPPVCMYVCIYMC